ncbi:MAG TPA: CGNR zinc finger domain-containing protein [Trebonia sp.]|nr:CGNR zinc finger domain-containing protein [Trebonia sp.]
MSAAMEIDEALLLDLLNTTPVIDGEQRDEIADAVAGQRWLAAHGQRESAGEWQALVAARSALQDVVRGVRAPAALTRWVDAVRYEPAFDGDGLTWTLSLPDGRSAAARAVLAWDVLRATSPGRLRPCANPDCRLFLIDHSKSNSARWCSMAVCGNRMKARRHYQRARQAPADAAKQAGPSLKNGTENRAR